ncbi:hypothetical protein PROVRUST_06967 [Providencia rustigianii DSM 4541]|uniref:Uncharacterized protein n=3 Tax=Providencia rustigianii TaxID=158850 RepID=D1P416_9GAMM|nr:hypothetical protein PROVRUST_06967 [Providencia rustigianii DSM 4541]
MKKCSYSQHVIFTITIELINTLVETIIIEFITKYGPSYCITQFKEAGNIKM